MKQDLTIQVLAPNRLDKTGIKTALSIRKAVFCNEMNIPLEIEVDGLDPECFHVLVFKEGKAVGTGRIHMEADGRCHLARVAVLKEYRGRGIGIIITEELICLAKENKTKTVYLHAEVEATRLYRKFGFVESGAIFSEPGFPHVKMVPMELEIRS